MIRPPTFYTVLLAVTLAFTASYAASAQSSDPLSRLYACEAVAEKDAQLDCFLTETARLRVGESAGELVTIEKEEVADYKEFQTTKEIKTTKSRTLAIRSATTYGRNNYLRFTLENGEVWEQTESGRVRLGRGNPDRLTIKKASFGSFFGKVNDKRSSFRVRQVK